MSSEGRTIAHTVVVGSRPLRSYLLDIIVSFNNGIDLVEIRGRGKNIYRAVTLYNMLKNRLGDNVKLERVEIGSTSEKGRRVSFIKIIVKRV